MAFEAAFGVTAILFVTFTILYAKSRKGKDDLMRHNIQLEADLKAAKNLEQYIPMMTKDMSADMIRDQNEIFKVTTTDPLNKTLDDLRNRMDDFNRQNATNYETFNTVKENTKAISDVLMNAQKRGRYAEMTIERILQMSGFEKGTHYHTQVGNTKKLDFVVSLPDDRKIILDSKTPLDALQKSINATDESTKSQYLDEHVKVVKQHIKSLSKKEYWEGESVLECVVMVMPEYALLPALEHDNNLIEYAWGHKIVLVTPSILMVLLRAVDIIWKQNTMSDTVKEIGKLSSDLYSRLCKFADHYSKTGKELSNVVKKYNESIGSWDTRIVPAADRLAQAGASINKMPDVKPIDNMPRHLVVDKDEQ